LLGPNFVSCAIELHRCACVFQ